MQPRRYNFSQFTALIIDDNRFIRGIVVQMCRSFGFGGIVDVDDAAAAFEVLKDRAIDIIICDWAMQPLDGLDFTRLVRTSKDLPNPFVPVIMLTGHTETSNVVAARNAGITEFLAKPLSAKTLLQRIVHVIESPRPFVRTPRFFGPDRRRKFAARDGADRRKDSDGDDRTPAVAPGEATLSQDEIEALMRS